MPVTALNKALPSSSYIEENKILMIKYDRNLFFPPEFLPKINIYKQKSVLCVPMCIIIPPTYEVCGGI